MNLKIQILGLIFNIYLVFLLTSRKSHKTSSHSNVNKLQSELLIAGYTNFHTSQDKNRLKTLNRIGILQQLCYCLFELDFILAGLSPLQAKSPSGTNSLNQIELSLKDGIYKINSLISTFIIFILLLALVIFLAQNHYYNPASDSTPSEQYLILLTNILGITSLLASNDWVMTIVSWELFNFSLYLLVSLNSYSESSLSSSLKYFLLSALSTGFLLLGVSILYYLTGTTHYDNLYSSLSQLSILSADGTKNFAIFQILFTLLFKLSAAPFYHWAPERGCGKSSIIGT